jgi:hypothetical protein
MLKQEVQGRTNCLLPFDMTWSHTKYCLQQFFVATPSSLLSCYLAERGMHFSETWHSNDRTAVHRWEESLRHAVDVGSGQNLHRDWRIASSGMLRRKALVRTDVSEELSVSIIRVRRIGELGTLAVTSNRRTLRKIHSVHRLLVRANVVPSSPILVMEALRSSETSVLTKVTRRNIPEDAILHSHRRENLKFT